MDETRTWTQRERTVEESAKILHALDARTLQRRAIRLSIEIPIELPLGYEIPHRTTQLFDEAGACYTNGQYNGCILVLATGVEDGLRKLLKASQSRRLHKLIQDGVNVGIIKVEEANVLLELKDYRNQATHSDIVALASGLKLSHQTVRLTQHGAEASSDWEDFEPESQSDMETAVALRAERKVGDIFAKVREVVYDIFDRC